MGPMIVEEEILRTLIEKCDMYDYIDAVLDLKFKYSQYEMAQLSREMNNMKRDNAFDNFDYYKEIRNKV